jgi:acyl-[acyl-carrier-protein] desaturase
LNTPISQEADRRIVHELSATAEELIHQHDKVARTWDSQDVVPWDNAVIYNPSLKWSPEIYPLDQGVRSALYVNELTEINLPYYTNTLLKNAPDNHPLVEWSRRWTAEEWRHSDAILNWIRLTGAYNPQDMEAGRVAQMKSGDVPQPATTIELICYTIMQELATAVAHRNTAKHLDKERGGKKMLGIVAGDEMLHHRFYLELGKAALQIDPDTVMVAFKNQYIGFDMPGQSIPNFGMHAQAIAKADIYSEKHFHEEVVMPVIKELGLFAIEGLRDDGQMAQERIMSRTRRFEKRLLRAAESNE